MKNLNTSIIESTFKVSKSTAIEIVFSDLHINRKIYLNRGNQARSTIGWLVKKFGVTFQTGNDSPRGGKRGDYVTFESNEAFEKFAQEVNAIDERISAETEARNREKKAAIESMIITPSEKEKFLQKVEGLSNKQARKEAHKFAAKKLDFWSTKGMKKFFELK